MVVAAAKRDMFNRKSNVFGGAFSADSATLHFATGGDADLGEHASGSIGLLIQNIQASFTQQTQSIFEVGSPQFYYVGGRDTGNMSIQRFIGPTRVSQAFYKKYGDLCQAATNTVSVSASVGCDVDLSTDALGFMSYDAHFCVITGVTLGMQAANSLISNSIQMIFGSMDYQENVTEVTPAGKLI